MSNYIDLNCDMGELPGDIDAQLMPFVTSANICCGLHAGSWQITAQTIALADQHGVAVGAHPGYDDRANFGRCEMQMAAAELRDLLLYQIGAIDGLCRAIGVPLSHIKPHGALYNQAAHDLQIGAAIISALQSYKHDIMLYALAGSPLVALTQAAGLSVVEESFADRAYEPDGRLRSRSLPGAILEPEAAAAQAVRIATLGEVIAYDGTPVRVQAQTLCVHGDNPQALATVQAVRAALEAAKVTVKAFGRDDS